MKLSLQFSLLKPVLTLMKGEGLIAELKNNMVDVSFV